MPRFSVGRLKDLQILTDDGRLIGRLRDLVVNELTGEILSIVCEPELDEPETAEILTFFRRDKEGCVFIPFKLVKKISHTIILDEKLLKLYIIKKSGRVRL